MSRFNRFICSLGVVLAFGLATSSAFGGVYSRYQRSVLEGYLSGQAEIIRAFSECISARATMIKAQADAQAALAKAAQTVEQTRGIALDNDLKRTKTYFEKRVLNENYQAQTAAPPPTQEDLIRYSRAGVPERPTAYQLEPTRGTIYWPEVFRQEDFLEHRIRMDALFSQRNAEPAGIGGTVYHQTQKVVAEMRDLLRDHLDILTPMEYTAARKFLDSLAYESQFPSRIEGVAKR
jgi:hypothetical protein